MDDEIDERVFFIIRTTRIHLIWRTNGGVGVWTATNLRVMKPLKRSEQKRKKHLENVVRVLNCADDWFKRSRARAGGKDKGRCKGRETEREMRWTTVERPSWDVDLGETWWDWLPEIFFGSP